VRPDSKTEFEMICVLMVRYLSFPIAEAFPEDDPLSKWLRAGTLPRSLGR